MGVPVFLFTGVRHPTSHLCEPAHRPRLGKHLLYLFHGRSAAPRDTERTFVQPRRDALRVHLHLRRSRDPSADCRRGRRRGLTKINPSESSSALSIESMIKIMRFNFPPASSSETPSIAPESPGMEDMIFESEPLSPEGQRRIT